MPTTTPATRNAQTLPPLLVAQEQEVSLTHLIIHCYNVIVRTDNYNIIVFLAEKLPVMFPLTCYPYLGIILWTTCGNIQSNVILLHDIVLFFNLRNLFYVLNVKQNQGGLLLHSSPWLPICGMQCSNLTTTTVSTTTILLLLLLCITLLLLLLLLLLYFTQEACSSLKASPMIIPVATNAKEPNES